MQKSSEKDLAIIYLKEAILNFNQAVQKSKKNLCGMHLYNTTKPAHNIYYHSYFNQMIRHGKRQ